jgi:hypothetical protein
VLRTGTCREHDTTMLRVADADRLDARRLCERLPTDAPIVYRSLLRLVTRTSVLQRCVALLTLSFRLNDVQ